MADKRRTAYIIILCWTIIFTLTQVATSEELPATEKGEPLQVLQGVMLELVPVSETDVPVSPIVLQAAKHDLVHFLTQVTRIMPPGKSIDRSPENSDSRMEPMTAEEKVPVAPHLLETASDALAEFLAELSEIVPPAKRSMLEKNETSKAELPDGDASPQLLDALANALSDLVDEISNTMSHVESTKYRSETNETSTTSPETEVPPEIVEAVASALVDLITQISHSRPSTSALPAAASNATGTVMTSPPLPEIGISAKVLEALANALVDLVSQMPTDE